MKKDSKATHQDDTGAQPPENDGESFGAWLCRQRSGRGIELQEIAESSKISLQYLKAFEADRFDLLPGEVFAKGFLRQYAGYVGLDQEEVLNFYLAASQPDDDEDSPEPRPRGLSSGTSIRFISLTLLVIGLLVAVVWWLSRSEDGGFLSAVGMARDASNEVSSDSPSPPEVNVENSTGASGASGGPGGASQESPVSEPTVSSTGVPEIQQGVVTSALAAGEVLPPAGSVSTDGGSGTIASETSSAAAAMQIVAEFSDSCWVEAKVDGERRVSITKVQGESLLLEAEESVDFVFGNVHAVRLEVNGQAFPLTPRRGTSRLGVHIDRSVLAATVPAAVRVGDGGAAP